MHIEAIHERKKLFECTECSTKFSQKNNLKIHIETFHKGRKIIVAAAENCTATGPHWPIHNLKRLS